MQYHECVLECTIPFYPLLFLILGVAKRNIEDCLYWQIIDYNMLPRPRKGMEGERGYINPIVSSIYSLGHLEKEHLPE